MTCKSAKGDVYARPERGWSSGRPTCTWRRRFLSCCVNTTVFPWCPPRTPPLWCSYCSHPAGGIRGWNREETLSPHVTVATSQQAAANTHHHKVELAVGRADGLEHEGDLAEVAAGHPWQRGGNPEAETQTYSEPQEKNHITASTVCKFTWIRAHAGWGWDNRYQSCRLRCGCGLLPPPTLWHHT